MLRAAVAAKTPLGIKAKEAMEKVSSFWYTILPVLLLFHSVCFHKIDNLTLHYKIFRENLFLMTWLLASLMKQWRNHHVRKVSFLMVFQELWSKHRRYCLVWHLNYSVSFFCLNYWDCVCKSRMIELFAILLLTMDLPFFLFSLMRCCRNRVLKLTKCSILQLMTQSLRSELLDAGYTHPVAEPTIQSLLLPRFLGLMM